MVNNARRENMKKLTVYSKERGVRTLKEGVTLEQYQTKHPDAIKVCKPSLATLERWNSDCGCKALDGCWVEPDGTCEHGFDSWLLALGYI
jgi:hypothetical protein